MSKAKKEVSQTIFDRVKDFETLCKEIGEPLSNYQLQGNETKRQIANLHFEKYCMLVDFFNEGWVPDFWVSSQTKYEIVMRLVSGRGWVFYFDRDYNDRSWSTVGARLVVRDGKVARH